MRRLLVLALLLLASPVAADDESRLERAVLGAYGDLSSDYETYAGVCFGQPLLRDLQTRHQQARRLARERAWTEALGLLDKNDRVLKKALAGLAVQEASGGRRARLARCQGEFLRQHNRYLMALHFELVADVARARSLLREVLALDDRDLSSWPGAVHGLITSARSALER